MENQIEIAQALEDFRKQAADKFIEQFIGIWEGEGFTVEDLIEAIAHYLHKHKPNNSEIDVAVRKLEESAQQYRDSRQYDQLSQDSSSN